MDATIRLWDVSKGYPCKNQAVFAYRGRHGRQRGKGTGLECLASVSCGRMASNSATVVAGSEDGSLMRVDMRTPHRDCGMCIDIKGGLGKSAGVKPTSLVLAKESETLFARLSDGHIVSVDMRNLTKGAVTITETPLPSVYNLPQSIALSPDGSVLMVGVGEREGTKGLVAEDGAVVYLDTDTMDVVDVHPLVGMGPCNVVLWHGVTNQCYAGTQSGVIHCTADKEVMKDETGRDRPGLLTVIKTKGVKRKTPSNPENYMRPTILAGRAAELADEGKFDGKERVKRARDGDKEPLPVRPFDKGFSHRKNRD
ncbi:hypothetical protein KIPB_004718 [Kipferlia bialata]|uniref:Uncharacterized protein n=1 Tax=Kipferlia bialata TaxID=797122 RepID=A0A9K3CU74_9EUKA|nr:hypothetical protein KIPB_004718 [Kipferlia bialata]|eukprot:g4718.t1